MIFSQNKHSPSFPKPIFFIVVTLILAIFTLTGCYNNDNENNQQNSDTSKCIDLNNDHRCDVCNKACTECPVDNNRDHICDVCCKRASSCYDEDNTHVCDFCGLPILDCEDQDNDHMCDFCNLKLTKCVDSDKNHICDLCKTKLNGCEDSNPADHVCDWCEKPTSGCDDGNKDHFCDVCSSELSTCNDTDLDHLCDLCKKALTRCIDDKLDYLCDICGDRLPYISVTADKSCLVNGQASDNQYSIGCYMHIVLTYSADSEKTVKEWILYNSDGVEIARIAPAELFTIHDPGSYYVTPVFN